MPLFFLNRWLSSAIGWETPYELLFKRKVEYNKLNFFGCLCYSTDVNLKKDKFKARAIKYIFLGFSPGNKGYKLFDYNVKNFIVSCNVVFHEQVFPFINKGKESCKDLVSLPVIPILHEEEEEDNKVQNLVERDEQNDNITENNVEDQITTRHSTREKRKSNWLSDFVCNVRFVGNVNFVKEGH